MADRIAAKVDHFPDDGALAGERAVVVHHLYGNENQINELAEELASHGQRPRTEPADEIGWIVLLEDDPTLFRRNVRPRISQLCRFAAAHHVRYKSWWLQAGRYTDYVSQ